MSVCVYIRAAVDNKHKSLSDARLCLDCVEAHGQVFAIKSQVQPSLRNTTTVRRHWFRFFFFNKLLQTLTKLNAFMFVFFQNSDVLISKLKTSRCKFSLWTPEVSVCTQCVTSLDESRGGAAEAVMHTSQTAKIGARCFEADKTQSRLDFFFFFLVFFYFYSTPEVPKTRGRRR